MAPSPEPQPGDWHETLVDLLAAGRGIPEDRARRLLARHAEEVRAATPASVEQHSEVLARPKVNPDRHKQNLLQALGMDCTRDWVDICNAARGIVKQLAELKDQPAEQVQARSDALAAIDRVQAVAREWEFMSGRREARRELLAALDAPTKER